MKGKDKLKNQLRANYFSYISMFNSIMYKIFITLICIIHTITFVLAQDNIFPINFNTNAEYAYLVDYESVSLHQVSWLRFQLDQIVEKKSHKKIRRKNSEFQVRYATNYQASELHNSLFERYVASIDFQTYPSITEALCGDDNVNIFQTNSIEVFDGDKLIAVGIYDVGSNAAQSIMHFYDPDYSLYSLGKYLVLLTVDHLIKNNYIFYYPGYVVAGRPKFDYKLFIGEEVACYFDPEKFDWLLFDQHRMIDLEYTEDDVVNFVLMQLKKG
jgi:arginine-tRNA-protein transferase